MSDGLSFAGKGGSVRTFAKRMINFMNGKTKIKPSGVLKTMSKVLRTSGNLAGQVPKFAKWKDKLERAASLAEKGSSKLESSGRGVGGADAGIEFSAGMGGGKWKGFKAAASKFKSFLEGKTKLKPSMILKTGSKVLGVAGNAADFFGRKGAASVLKRIGSKVGEFGDKAEKSGRGVSFPGGKYGDIVLATERRLGTKKKK